MWTEWERFSHANKHGTTLTETLKVCVGFEVMTYSFRWLLFLGRSNEQQSACIITVWKTCDAVSSYYSRVAKDGSESCQRANGMQILAVLIVTLWHCAHTLRIGVMFRPELILSRAVCLCVSLSLRVHTLYISVSLFFSVYNYVSLLFSVSVSRSL